jgi:hypothetical protein
MRTFTKFTAQVEDFQYKTSKMPIPPQKGFVKSKIIVTKKKPAQVEDFQ